MRVLSPKRWAVLYAFLTLLTDGPGSVTVKIAANGEMTFSLPAAAALARKIVDPTVMPPFLH
jgi:hypothetical protein